MNRIELSAKKNEQMMKKKMCFVIGIFMIVLSWNNRVLAQIKYSAGFEYLVPLLKLSNNYDYGLTGSIAISRPVLKGLDVSFAIGYSHIKGVHLEDQYVRYNIPDLKALPASIGLRYYIDQYFFVEASGGALWMLDPDKRFGGQYSGGAGVRYKNFELSGKLMQWNNGGIINFAGLQLAYSL